MKPGKMLGFAGFPAGKLPATSVPNLFFGELLPLIDDLGELKTTLHLFWLIGHKARQGRLAYARLSELLDDARLLDGLATGTRAGDAALRDALERATARGTLLHATVRRGELTEEWYMINSPNGREVLERLHSGALNLVVDVAEDVQLQVERPNIFVLYEQNIGVLTPMMAEELREAEQQYPAGWVSDAFHEAVTANKRSWRYVQAILRRWKDEGKDEGRSATIQAQRDGQPRQRNYVPEGYEDLIDH